MTSTRPGISGFAACVPRARVSLAAWADWTGASVERVLARVGTAFRLCGPRDDAYTLAAGAVLRLLVQYDVDPTRVGFLAFATESSADAAVGAVIVKGMLDEALLALGRPALPDDCELPEVKSACLGGVYALKGAVRYVSQDGRGRVAIVVAADTALYARGSSGECTQGAGAVALLVEEHATLCEVDLTKSAAACRHRGPDFRKPHGDYPVYNGRYTTVCYLDATLRAGRALAARLGVELPELVREAEAIFLHRPYRQLPVNALAWLHTWGLGTTASGRAELGRLCAEVGCDATAVLDELRAPLAPADPTAGTAPGADRHQVMTATRHLRSQPDFEALVAAKFLGFEALMEFGNLYSAALPLWLAAGFDEALTTGRPLAGTSLLALGYGSGDASEAFVLDVVEGWEPAARKIGLAAATAGAVDLDRAAYERLHDGDDPPELPAAPGPRFELGRTSPDVDLAFHDAGVRTYRFVITTP